MKTIPAIIIFTLILATVVTITCPTLQTHLMKAKILFTGDLILNMVSDLGDDRYMLIDTRNVPGTQVISFLTKNQAAITLEGPSPENETELDWAIKNKLIIILDSKYVPLAIASPELWHKFEEDNGMKTPYYLSIS